MATLCSRAVGAGRRRQGAIRVEDDVLARQREVRAFVGVLARHRAGGRERERDGVELNQGGAFSEHLVRARTKIHVPRAVGARPRRSCVRRSASGARGQGLGGGQKRSKSLVLLLNIGMNNMVLRD